MTRGTETKVWDPLVRGFHWSLVAVFTGAYLTGEEWSAGHAVAGYTVLVLVGLRLVWGLLGTDTARFTGFVPAPAEAAGYLRDLFRGRARAHRGHNPAGGAMVVFLLVFLLAVAATGLMAYGAEGHGPWAGVFAGLGPYGGAPLEALHARLVDATLVLVALHIAGVFVSSRLEGESLIRAMVTGRKRPAGPADTK